MREAWGGFGSAREAPRSGLVQQVLRGVGSIIDLAPAPRGKFDMSDSDNDRLRKDFERVGNDMRKVFDAQTRHEKSIAPDPR